MADEYSLKLDIDELGELLDALDSHIYWELSSPEERNNGDVFLPEDTEPGQKMHRDPSELTEEDKARHTRIRECRILLEKLQKVVTEGL